MVSVASSLRDAIVTIPRFDLRAIDNERLARCDIAIGSFLLLLSLFLLLEWAYSSNDGDFSSINFWEIPVGVTFVIKFFFESVFFTWNANGECLG